ncbi:F-box protein PP2-B15-like [Fagus crenata]
MGGVIDMLPEDCVCTIPSFTSPTDTFRSSMVSSTFRSAAESDFVWERFLPADYKDVVSRLDTPLTYTAMKELFHCLCNPVLIYGGRKSFKLEKLSGKISYMLSARELSITWGNDPMYWSWKSIPQSRFSEVAELRTTRWLEIHGKIKTEILHQTQNMVSIEVGNKVCNGMAYLRNEDCKKQQMESLFYGNRNEMLRKRVIEGGERFPSEREDGWMEIELGEFFSGEAYEEVKMSLMEVKGYQLKGGLIIEGIEVRPKD